MQPVLNIPAPKTQIVKILDILDHVHESFFQVYGGRRSEFTLDGCSDPRKYFESRDLTPKEVTSSRLKTLRDS